MPLPRTITRLQLASVLVGTTAFVLSMTHSFGSDSLWTVPAAWILTLAHHFTLYFLSRRRSSGPPPLPHPDETTASPVKDMMYRSRASVYHPASKSSQASFAPFAPFASGVADTITLHSADEEPWISESGVPPATSATPVTRSERATGTTFHAEGRGGGGGGSVTTPSKKYPSFTLTTANCAVTSFLAVLWTVGAALSLRTHPVDGSGAIYFVRSLFPIPEAGILWTLFALFVRARTRWMKEGEFVRMDNW